MLNNSWGRSGQKCWLWAGSFLNYVVYVSSSLACSEYFGSAIQRARVSFIGPEQFSPRAPNCSISFPVSGHQQKSPHGPNQMGRWQEPGGDTRVHQGNQRWLKDDLVLVLESRLGGSVCRSKGRKVGEIADLRWVLTGEWETCIRGESGSFYLSPASTPFQKEQHLQFSLTLKTQRCGIKAWHCCSKKGTGLCEVPVPWLNPTTTGLTLHLPSPLLTPAVVLSLAAQTLLSIYFCPVLLLPPFPSLTLLSV